VTVRRELGMPIAARNASPCCGLKTAGSARIGSPHGMRLESLGIGGKKAGDLGGVLGPGIAGRAQHFAAKAACAGD
jgi:hypothetical protein